MTVSSTLVNMSNHTGENFSIAIIAWRPFGKVKK